jgi:hypothetical protein
MTKQNNQSKHFEKITQMRDLFFIPSSDACLPARSQEVKGPKRY